MRASCSSRMLDSFHSNMRNPSKTKNEEGLLRFGCLGCCEVQPQMFRMLSCLQGLGAGFRGLVPQFSSGQGLKLHVEACEQREIPSICNLDFDDQPLPFLYSILSTTTPTTRHSTTTLPVLRRLQQISRYKSIRAIEERGRIWPALPPEAGTSHGARGRGATMISSLRNRKYSTVRHPSHLQPSCGQQEDPFHNGKSCLYN